MNDAPAAPRNAYLEHYAARRDWDARFADGLVRERAWRRAALALGAATLLLSAGVVMLALRAPVLPVLVRVDQLGRAEYAGELTPMPATDDALRRAFFSRWIEDWRAVMADGVAQRAAIERVYAQIAAGSAAQEAVSEFYRRDPPAQRGRTQTVGVQVASIYPGAGLTYEIEWVETVRDLDGTTRRVERWKGALTFTQSAPADEATLRRNPLGLYVTNLAWSKVIS
jgi:type IV secretory pathway TrbF-like protein